MQKLVSSLPSSPPRVGGHVYSAVNAGDDTQLQLGDIHHHYYTGATNFGQANQDYNLGLCLGLAPTLPPDAFKGREAELDQLRVYLTPSEHQQQCIVSIVGMGGIGKTQLSLAYARKYADQYSAIFWISAKNETSIKQGLSNFGAVKYTSLEVQQKDNATVQDATIQNFRTWLSALANDAWLVIFDNYDDPNLPGLRSTTGFDIREFFPDRAQGSILITTRSKKLTFSKQLPLSMLESAAVCVSILSYRADRNLSEDQDAQILAHRLHGLPLALATAGTFLASSNMTCREYYQLYETMWLELVGSESDDLFEYEDRNLASTWAISLEHVRAQDPDAAKLLELFAYLGPSQIWYELIRSAASDELLWCSRVTTNTLRFNRAMSLLHNYSLINNESGRYSLHPCLHDWLVRQFATRVDQTLFSAAARGVFAITDGVVYHQWNSWRENSKVNEHVDRLNSFQDVDLWHKAFPTPVHLYGAFYVFGNNYCERRNWKNAKFLFDCALDGLLDSNIPDKFLTLQVIDGQGKVFYNLGDYDMARDKFSQAAEGFKLELGEQAYKTLTATQHLADTYQAQGDIDSCIKLHLYILKQTSLGRPEHFSPFGSLLTLGDLYYYQRKYMEAKEMYQRAKQERMQLSIFKDPKDEPIEDMIRLAIVCFQQGEYPETMSIVSRAVANFHQNTDIDDRQNIALGLIGVLCVQSKAETAANMACPQLHVDSVFGTITWNRILPAALSELGSVFRDILGDDVNAQRAYNFVFDAQEDWAAVHHTTESWVICDGCDEPIDRNTGRNTCKSCYDTDLCNGCMISYLVDNLLIPHRPGCQGHSYLKVGSLTEQHVAQDVSKAFKDWLRQVRLQYGY